MTIELFETDDPRDRRLALGADRRAGPVNAAGLVEAADVHAPDRIGALAGENDDQATLALALAVRSLRHGSVCLDLLAGRPSAPPGRSCRRTARAGSRAWPASRLAAAGVLRVEGSVLYLDRYWREECQVRDDLDGRLALPPPRWSTSSGSPPWPARSSVPGTTSSGRRRWWPPGRGRTRAHRRTRHRQDHRGGAGCSPCSPTRPTAPLRIALTAPTGKAAARLQEAVRTALATPTLAPYAAAVGEPRAQTLHRLLGWTAAAAATASATTAATGCPTT